VTVVPDGRAALGALEQGHFDLVLMDVQMPVMDGLEAARAIRAQEDPGQHIPIVALTAHAMSGNEPLLREAGMDGYVAKPVCADRLLRVIAECCASGTRRCEPCDALELMRAGNAARTPD
jgi:two-component system sensor histidine kinase/response regulator